jgi:hypothetical protein
MTFQNFLISLLSLMIAGNAVAIEEPKFEQLSKDGNIEVRRYAPLIVAEVTVDGDMDAASNQGFRLIADFIFGNNRAAGATAEKASDKIAMTAPVTAIPVTSKPAKTAIAMTAPVTAEPLAAEGESSMSANRWRIHFVMPSQYSMANLPVPNNAAVTIRELPARTFAALVYSGFNGTAKIQQRTDELMAWLKSKKLQPLGSPQLSRYDAPWVLPMFRRNEIMVEISSQ